MEFAEQRKLEVELDRMVMSNQDAVVPLAQEGQQLMKQRKFEEARDVYYKALKEYKRPLRLMNVITDAGLAVSNAEARRLIESGKVKVDGKVIRRHETNVTRASTIKVGHRTVHLDK
jgi:tyrosyl-tRNA synthetase